MAHTNSDTIAHISNRGDVVQKSALNYYREITEEKYGRKEQKEEFYEGYYSGRIV